MNSFYILTYTPSFMSVKGERKLDMSSQDILRENEVKF